MRDAKTTMYTLKLGVLLDESMTDLWSLCSRSSYASLPLTLIAGTKLEQLCNQNLHNTILLI